LKDQRKFAYILHDPFLRCKLLYRWDLKFGPPEYPGITETTPTNSLNMASVHQKQPVPNVAVSAGFIKKIEGASYELGAIDNKRPTSDTVREKIIADVALVYLLPKKNAVTFYSNSI